MQTFKIQLLDSDCLPEQAHPTDACFDLKARCFKSGDEELDEIELNGFERVLAPAGFKIALSTSWEALIRPRSGLAIKQGITVLNTPGTIDADYRGEVGVILYNASSKPVKLSKGDRIAQMAIRKYDAASLFVAYSLDETSRGEGGFGSTGL